MGLFPLAGGKKVIYLPRIPLGELPHKRYNMGLPTGAATAAVRAASLGFIIEVERIA
jgi:hypothetical protein